MELIAKPFVWILQVFYSFTHNYAIALIFFTIIIKLLLLFLNIKQQQSSAGMARIRPKLTAIRKRYEGRKDPNAQIEYNKDCMALYKQEKVSASMGCLPLLIQLPFIAVLYNIVQNPLTYICKVGSDVLTALKTQIYTTYTALSNVPGDVVKAIMSTDNVSNFKISELNMISVIKANPEAFTEFTSAYEIPNFNLGSINLAQTPTLSFDIIVLIPILVGVFQLLSSLVIQLFSQKPDKSSPEAAQTAKTMLYMNLIMPLITVWFAFKMPAIIGVYWIYQSVIGAVIQIILSKLIPIPSYTEEEVQAIIEEYNRDYVPPQTNYSERRSLHYIDSDDEDCDDDDDDEYTSDTDVSEENTVHTPPADIPNMPKRRLYDKNGNKIRSLHFIDDDDDEIETKDGAEPEAQHDTKDEDQNNRKDD